MKNKLSIIMLLTVILSVFFQFVFMEGVYAVDPEPIAVAVEATEFDATNVGGDGDNTLLWKRGDALTTGGILRITPQTGGGTAVKRNQIKLTDGFSTYFQIQLHDHINTGGDGLAFVIYKADEPQLGSYGGGLGYQGIDDAIAVEFDTYNNEGGDINDDSANHAAIMVNGSNNHSGQPGGSKATYAAIKTNVINVWIDYNVGTVTATFGTGATKTDGANVTISRDVSSDVALAGEDVFVGFSASTGWAKSNNDVLKWYFKDTYVENGLDPTAGTYSQAASAVGLVLDQDENPNTVTMAVYDAAGDTMTNQDLDVYIDDDLIEAINTGGIGSYDYAISGLAAGEHRIRAVAGGGASNYKDFTITITAPDAPVLESVDAGYKHVEIVWSEVDDATGYKVYVSTESGSYGSVYESVSDSVYNCDVTGLNNGTRYYFSVKATNLGGDSAYSNELSAVPHSSSSGSNNSVNSETTTPFTGGIVLVNGKEENAGTAEDSTEGEQTVTTIVVDDDALQKKLEQEGNGALVTLPVKTDSDIAVGELTGQMVKDMEKREAVLEIRTDGVSYKLPADEINIDAISDKLGNDVELKDIKVTVRISDLNKEDAKFVESVDEKGTFQIVMPSLDFEVSCSYNGKIVEVNRFNSYIERTIAIPEGVDPAKITTGIVVEPDGAVRHVPTKITVIDGKYYAVINSLTNSIYSIAWNPVTFADVENHWAKDEVNDMGSRMIINGIGNSMFEPNRDITRAEFAAIIVRALGLRPGTGNDSFNDIKDSDWYCGYVKTAYSYSIITGYSDGSFKPNGKITREEAMTMIARAMKITKLGSEVNEGQADSVLARFNDGSNVASWAKNFVAGCVNTGTVKGRVNGDVAPKDNITRAETAAIIKRLLQKSNLI